MRTALLLGAAALAGCSVGYLVKAEPTPEFPRTWGEGEAGDAPTPQPRPQAPLAPTPPIAPVPRPSVARRMPPGVVAVLPFDLGHSGIDSDTRMAFEEAIRSVTGDELSPAGFTVLTGETTLAVLADNGVDSAKACEAACALQAARELKAKLFISGAVARTEGEYVAFVRVYDADSGRQLGSLQLEGSAVKDLRRAFNERAPAFFKRVLQVE